jgi:hypothetical protein
MIEHVLIACHAGIAGPSQSVTFQRDGIIHTCISQRIYNQFPADGVMHPAPDCLCETEIEDAPTPVTPPRRQRETESDDAPPRQRRRLLSPGPLLASTSITPPPTATAPASPELGQQQLEFGEVLVPEVCLLMLKSIPELT